MFDCLGECFSFDLRFRIYVMDYLYLYTYVERFHPQNMSVL
jgi:hypothetical protein